MWRAVSPADAQRDYFGPLAVVEHEFGTKSLSAEHTMVHPKAARGCPIGKAHTHTRIIRGGEPVGQDHPFRAVVSYDRELQRADSGVLRPGDRRNQQTE